MGTRAYLIGEGYSNLKKHSGKTFATMLIICATMLILSLFIIAYVNIETNAKIITENQGLKALISDDVDEADVEAIGEKIKQISNVKTITYLDKDAALEDAKEILKEYAYLLDGYESFNPFPRSYIVVFENLESTENVKEAVESVEGIYKVAYNDTIIDTVIKISDVGSIVVIALGVVMLLVSVFIISNTIKLSVYSNKREIYIMKYIGATSKFIRYPFVVSGVLMGVGSALFTWVVVSLGYIVLYNNVVQLNSDLGSFGLVAYSSFWYIVLGVDVIVGIMLGGIGSRIAIKKYLKDFKPSKIAIKEEKTKSKENIKEKKEQERKEKEDKKRADKDAAWSKKQQEIEEAKQKIEQRKQEEAKRQLEKAEKEEKKEKIKNQEKEEKAEKDKKEVEPELSKVKVNKSKYKKEMSELEAAKELRRAGRRNAWKK